MIHNLWEKLILKLYKRTDHYTEGLIHDSFMHKLLDEMGAPTHPNNDPKRSSYGPYGRLKAWWDSLPAGAKYQ